MGPAQGLGREAVNADLNRCTVKVNDGIGRRRLSNEPRPRSQPTFLKRNLCVFSDSPDQKRSSNPVEIRTSFWVSLPKVVTR